MDLSKMLLTFYIASCLFTFFTFLRLILDCKDDMKNDGVEFEDLNTEEIQKDNHRGVSPLWTIAFFVLFPGLNIAYAFAILFKYNNIRMAFLELLQTYKK